MRVLQVTNFFKPSWEAGGPPRAVYEISKELVKRGHEVTVYTTDGYKYRLNIEKNKPIDVDGIRVYYFRNLSNYLTRKWLIPIPYYSPIIAKKEIKEFDIIHIHEYRTFLTIVTSYYAKKYGIPYILQPRGSIPRTKKTIQKKIFDDLFGSSIIKNASKIIATSTIESGLYKSIFPDLKMEKIIHLPNGINLNNYKDLPKKGSFRKKHEINNNEKMILFLGRIHERKGIDILIEAFSRLKTELKNVKLVIAGPDEGFLNKLQIMIKKLDMEKDVIFPGPLYEKEKLEAYIDADVFVLPSKDQYESFGNVALEACACGTPTIVTSVCGVSEWVNTIEIVEPSSHNLYINLLEILNKSDNERMEIGKKAREEARKLSWEKTVEKLEKIYEEMLEGSK